MRLFAFTLLFSVQSLTLFDPFYDYIAKALVSTTVSYVRKGADVSGITQLGTLADAIDGLDTNTVISIIKNIPIDALANPTNLTIEQLNELFENNIDQQVIQDAGAELLATLTVEEKASFDAAIDGIGSVLESVQDILNSDITLFNFASLATDLLDTISKLGSAFPGSINSQLNILYEVLFYFSLIAEKGLTIYEAVPNFLRDLDDAIFITQYKFDNGIGTKTKCEIVQTNPIVYGTEVMEFTSDVVQSFWREIMLNAWTFWYNIWKDVPILEDYLLCDQNMMLSLLDYIEYGNQAIVGTLKELYVLGLPVMGTWVIPALENIYC